MPSEARTVTHEIFPPWAGQFLNELREHNLNTYNHSMRTGFMAYTLWKDLHPAVTAYGADTISPQDMLLAGVLHDINKRRISRDILGKKEELTIEEKTLISEHPFAGAAELVPYNRKVADIVRGHHRWGKNGIEYPDYGKNTDAQEAMRQPGYPGIEAAQRILAIADKADVAINRIRGIHGTSVETEMAAMQERFQKEIEKGHIQADWIYLALQLAWEMGDLELILNGR